MSVFFTDTDCEMDWTDAENLGINVIKMPYTINNQEYFYDYGKNTNIKEFYDLMRKGEVSITSALNQEDYINYFEPIFEKGEDIFYVHFSSELSGTFNHMNLALETLKEKYPDRKVTCFDTKNISLGAGLIAIEAAKLHNSGASDDELLEFLNDFVNKVSVYFYVDSLKYLKRGGRISTASAVFGTMLNVKPVLTVTKEGKLEKLTAVLGGKKALSFLFDKFVKEYKEDTNYECFIVDADNKACADELADKITKTNKAVKIRRLSVGPVIGSHAGPGTIGLIFVNNGQV